MDPPRFNDAKGMYGRGERIRTSGLLVPNQALYQAEPRPDVLHQFSPSQLLQQLFRVSKQFWDVLNWLLHYDSNLSRGCAQGCGVRIH